MVLFPFDMTYALSRAFFLKCFEIIFSSRTLCQLALESRTSLIYLVIDLKTSCFTPYF